MWIACIIVAQCGWIVMVKEVYVIQIPTPLYMSYNKDVP